MSKNKKGVEFSSNIILIRALEDCIRASKKYTEGIRTIRKEHPIQGEEFLSRDFRKYYEVYPDVKVGLDMEVSDFFDWLWPDTICIDVVFHYNYRANKASVSIVDGEGAVSKLKKSVPGFGNALRIINGVREKSKV